ncbi:unnamed protein product [Amoebophrya sp. A25]|nr:unnamed protein product [Amoebophrya sp. A25]|eukprot:GSA25T00005091001.1
MRMKFLPLYFLSLLSPSTDFPLPPWCLGSFLVSSLVFWCFAFYVFRLPSCLLVFFLLDSAKIVPAQFAGIIHTMVAKKASAWRHMDSGNGSSGG